MGTTLAWIWHKMKEMNAHMQGIGKPENAMKMGGGFPKMIIWGRQKRNGTCFADCWERRGSNSYSPWRRLKHFFKTVCLIQSFVVRTTTLRERDWSSGFVTSEKYFAQRSKDSSPWRRLKRLDQVFLLVVVDVEVLTAALREGDWNGL